MFHRDLTLMGSIKYHIFKSDFSKMIDQRLVGKHFWNIPGRLTRCNVLIKGRLDLKAVRSPFGSISLLDFTFEKDATGAEGIVNEGSISFASYCLRNRLA